MHEKATPSTSATNTSPAAAGPAFTPTTWLYAVFVDQPVAAVITIVSLIIAAGCAYLRLT
ncbi:hypothetical protein Lfu02_75890 [Longispora fulva]|uniref:Uncharacterized protein n=1 Tax=Longispora fulva TaxID=619741 RepID=A0A8J7GP32_9ACTN|nr:hypothetical protein [Longispora fulva]MBG6136274.1 hypothetical protein [Longispora fulva]GIG63217.1 hypothetical protein Lfu02_75890 [Longispora fulva]